MNTTVAPSSPDLHFWIRRLASEAPALADLTSDQLAALAHSVVWSNLRDDLKRRSDLARIDQRSERDLFLAQASPTGSEATLRAYSASLDRLETWCRFRGIAVVEMGPRDADAFLQSLRTGTRAPASVRLDAAGAGSFFSFLERRHEAVTNPFRGTRSRPANLAVRPLMVPSEAEVAAMTSAADPGLRAVLVCLATRGLRVGALPTLVVRGTRFSGRSKGKVVAGRLPPLAVEAVAQAGLCPRRPFALWPARLLSGRIKALSLRLVRRGILTEAYSAHDFRHFFAVTQYTAHPDLHRLKVLLGHSGIAVTERYLQSLAVLE